VCGACRTDTDGGDIRSAEPSRTTWRPSHSLDGEHWRWQSVRVRHQSLPLSAHGRRQPTFQRARRRGFVRVFCWFERRLCLGSSRLHFDRNGSWWLKIRLGYFCTIYCSHLAVCQQDNWKIWANFHENWGVGRLWTREKLVKFWKRPSTYSVFLSYFIDSLIGDWLKSGSEVGITSYTVTAQFGKI